MKRLILLALVLTAFAPAGRAATAEPSAVSLKVIAYFAYPQTGARLTTAQGISNDGTVTGTFTTLQIEMGYTRTLDGQFSPPIVDPDGSRTFAQGINIDGLVAGFSLAPPRGAQGGHGFFSQDGGYSQYDLPGAVLTIIFGLNDLGDFTGLYTDSSGTTSPYLSTNGAVTTITVPGSSYVWPHGVNNRGENVGYYVTDGVSPEHGYFRRKNGGVTFPLDFPGAANTQLFGVNDRGTIVGFWYATDGSIHGLALLGLTDFSSLDIPGAKLTAVTGINNSNLVCGYYISSHNQQFGFVAKLVGR